MHIRSIQSQELKVFSSFSEQEKRNLRLETYIRSLWDEGTSAPESCFIAIDGERILGRVVYWAPTPGAIPTDIDFFDVNWTDDAYLQIGTTLIQESLAHLHTQGAQQIKYQLNHPNYLQPVTEQRLQLLNHLGFSLRCNGYRWETRDTTLRQEQYMLQYRPNSEIGEDIFLDIMKRTLAQSLDRGIQHDLANMGPEEGARKRLEDSRTLHLLPNGWQVAYTPEEKPVGVLMVARNDGGPIIDYLGVLPKQRGHGYIHDLLAHAVNTLLAHGATHIRSDCDVNNESIAQGFRKAGFTVFCTRSVYEKKSREID